ncbi:MAG: sensor domain-containing diguanylate cyclase [Burkholderiales bacterium]|nr:sensor domain-containing diguanylate cyclase [Burkholderiales bacterium]
MTAAENAEDAPDPLFDLAPVSLWLEDFSDVHDLLQRWRREGVTDIRKFLEARPAAIDEYFSCIRVLKVNQRTLDLYGARSLDELLAAGARIFAADDATAPIQEIEQLWLGATAYRSETVNHTLDGRRLDIRLNVNRLADAARPWDRMLMAIEDFTAERQAQEAARSNEAYALGLFELSPVSLWVEDFSEVKAMLDEVRARGITDFRTFVDVHPEFVLSCMERIRVVDVNRQTLALFGARSKEELLGRLADIFRDEMARSFTEQLIDCWQGKLLQTRETLNYGLQGDAIHLHMQWAVLPGHEEQWDLVQVALTDITARKKAEAYLEYLGKHDALTKLRNRAFYDDEITRLNRRGPFPVGVLAVDLNGLKGVNDELGHAAGDALLRRAGEALKKAVGDAAPVARVGGDEFVALLPRHTEGEMQMLLDSLDRVISLNNQYYQGPALSMAVGTAVCARAGELDAALRAADGAMFAAKRSHYQAHREHDRRH